jgi:hypothetical protein
MPTVATARIALVSVGLAMVGEGEVLSLHATPKHTINAANATRNRGA